MRKHLLAAATATALLGTAAGTARAAVLYEPFDYPAGDLHLNVNANGKTWYSSATSGTADYVQVAPAAGLTVPGLAASVGGGATFGGAGRTDRIEFGNYTSGTVYYSIALKITDLTGTSATGGAILGFNNTAQTAANDGTANQPSTIETRVVIKPVTGSTYQIGLDKGTGTAANFVFDTDHTYSTGDTVFLVGSYEFVAGAGNDVSRLWVNPSGAAFGDDGLMPTATLTNSTGTDVANISTFILRQTSAVVPAGITVDELRVDTTWAGVTPVPEPAALSLAGLAAAGLLARRRRGA